MPVSYASRTKSFWSVMLRAAAEARCREGGSTFLKTIIIAEGANIRPLQYTTQPVRKISGTGASIVSQATSLKCRCDQFQILCQCLALAGHCRDSLHVAKAIRAAAGVGVCVK